MSKPPVAQFYIICVHILYTVIVPNTDAPNTDDVPNTDAFSANFLMYQILTGVQIKRYIPDTSHRISQIGKKYLLLAVFY